MMAEAGGKVLIVDDSPESVELLTAMLIRAGYVVKQAHSGAEAQAQMASDRADLILLDIQMPEVNGFEVCRAFKEDPETRDIPVIFISALGDLESKLRGFDEGGVDFITKPFHFQEVTARVRAHVTIRKLQEELKSRFDAQATELVSVNDAYGRFVPHEFLSLLNKESITQVELADHEEREMTIMFADIRDFTPLSESMNPQENFRFLNSYLSRVSPVIGQHHGFIDKYIGDEIMALFPRSPDDAIQAAIALQIEVALYNQHRGSCGYDPVRIGISLHTGRLMLGIIGEDKRMEGTVISDSVNLASRLESLTKLYGASIIASETTVQGLREADRYKHRFLDEVRVRGRTNSIKLYEIYDGLADSVVDTKEETKAVFGEALAYYQAGQFQSAHPLFQTVVERDDGDKAAQVFLDRIAYFGQNGAPEGWSGVHEFAH
jgi:class 3 adenylate cyclase/ActR/RegA family two-component response regulator